MSKSVTPYSILKGIGAEKLREHIYRNISGEQFDSHDFNISFSIHFPDEYNRMLETHPADEDFNSVKHKVAATMGMFLQRNQEELHIKKIGKGKYTLSLNGTMTTTSLWQKTR
ncbi:MAG: hypothetical protein LUE26_04510 [Alistipes sp.]|nr:hypothetical protein [Alistipes sp.]